MKWGLHIHHNTLFTPMVEIMEAVTAYVKANEPMDWAPVRLKLARELTTEEVSKIPQDLLTLGEEVAALISKRLTLDAKLKKLNTEPIDWPKRVAVVNDLYRTNTAEEACTATWWDAIDAHVVELEHLHKEICAVDCPWNGRTILLPARRHW